MRVRDYSGVKPAFVVGFLVILLSSVAIFALTQHIYLLCIPLAYLYVNLLAIQWKAAYWVFLCFIPLSIHVELLPDSLSTTLPDEPVMWLLFLAFGVGVLLRPYSLPRWWWAHPITTVVILQLFWTAAAALYSQMGFLSLKFLLAKCWFLVAFFVMPVFLLQYKRHFARAFVCLLVPVLLTVLVIIIRHARLDFDFLLTNEAIGKLYYNHVEYAGVISAIFPLVLVAWRATAGKRLAIHLLFGVLLLVLIPSILLTYARAASVGVVFALGVGFAVRKKIVQWVMPGIFVAITVLLFALIPTRQYWKLQPRYEQTYMHADFGDHLLATFRGEDLSSMERLYRWIAAMRMSQAHPFVGFGPNTFYYYYRPYALTAFETYTSDNPEHSTTHNYFLYMLAEQGWPGMLLYALLLCVVLYTGQKTYHRFRDSYYKWCTLGLIMMFAVHFVTNFFSEMIETHKIGALFYIGIAALVILDHKSRVRSSNPLVVSG